MRREYSAPLIQVALHGAERIPAAVARGADEILLCLGRLPILGQGSEPPEAAAKPNRVPPGTASAPDAARLADMLTHCRVRGVKTVLDLSYPHTDRGLLASAELLRLLYRRGLDAALVADFGVLRMVRMEAPELAVHWAAVGGADALAMAAALGCKRAVLSPLLSLEETGALCAHKGSLEIQVPVWEPGCAASPAAPCYLSPSGARSAACEFDCGRAFTYGKGGEPALGVPGIDRLAQAAELAAMDADVFGLRSRDSMEAVALIPAARVGGEPQTDPQTPPNPVPIRFRFRLTPGRPAQLAVDDFEGHTLSIAGPEPQRTKGGDASAEEASYNTRLYQLGGTPYRCADARSRVAPGCMMPMETFVRMKAALLRKLDKARGASGERKNGRFRAGVRYLPRREEPVITVRARHLGQVTKELLALYPACLYMPLHEWIKDPEAGAEIVRHASEYGVPAAAVLPSQADSETVPALKTARAIGVTDGLARQPAQLELLRRLGFTARADFAASNSQTLKELKALGVASATLSAALSLPMVREMSHVMDTELVVYGRRPLLLSEACLIKRGGLCGCEARTELTDAEGAPYPLVREGSGHASVLLDEAKLWLVEHVRFWRRIGLWAARLDFTTENARECVQILERHVGIGRYEPNRTTTGKYMEIEG